MHRMIWLRIGSARVHLLKLAGAFFAFAAFLKVAEAAYQIFVAVQKATFAQVRPELIVPLFGWSIGAPFRFTTEDFVGVLLGPLAAFLFWIGLAVVAIMVYQSGRVLFPIEEYEQKVEEHHRDLIRKAVAAHKARRR